MGQREPVLTSTPTRYYVKNQKGNSRTLTLTAGIFERQRFECSHVLGSEFLISWSWVRPPESFTKLSTQRKQASNLPTQPTTHQPTNQPRSLLTITWGESCHQTRTGGHHWGDLARHMAPSPQSSMAPLSRVRSMAISTVGDLIKSNTSQGLLQRPVETWPSRRNSQPTCCELQNDNWFLDTGLAKDTSSTLASSNRVGVHFLRIWSLDHTPLVFNGGSRLQPKLRRPPLRLPTEAIRLQEVPFVGS